MGVGTYGTSLSDAWAHANNAMANHQISTHSLGAYPLHIPEPSTSRILGTFTVTKVENGLILQSGNKTYVMKNGQELAEQIVAIIAAEELK